MLSMWNILEGKFVKTNGTYLKSEISNVTNFEIKCIIFLHKTKTQMRE